MLEELQVVLPFMPMDVVKAKALDNCFSEMFPESVIKGFSYKDFRDGLSANYVERCIRGHWDSLEK